ncbi:MAG: hypothetical protein WD053_03760 [Gracilimonas sp.]
MKILIFLFISLVPVRTVGQVVSETILTNSSQITDEERISWKPINFTLVDSTYLDDHDIFYPHALTVNEKLDIALMAWGKRSVYLFEQAKLSESSKIETKRGRGPGEYESPFDMYFNNDMLWISDIGLRKIDVWDTDTKTLKHSFGLENRFVKPDQVVICKLINSNTVYLYVLSTQYGSGYLKKEGVIHSYILNDKELMMNNTFQELSEDQERYPYVITGDLKCNNQGELYYTGDFTGTIRKYDSDGNIIFFRGAINVVVEEPLFINLDDGMTRFNPKAPRINGELFIGNNGELFISHSRNRDRDIYGVDVYSASNGAYNFSFKLPAPAKEIFIAKDRLIAIEFNVNEGHDLKIYKLEGL